MASVYDVAIIGTGAGGGTLAWALAETGKRILLLERGDYVRREKENWSPRAVNVEGRYQTREVWYDGDGGALHPHTNYAVGGNTKFYGAALFRLRREDFGEVKHWGGVSPAWPIATAAPRCWWAVLVLTWNWPPSGVPSAAKRCAWTLARSESVPYEP